MPAEPGVGAEALSYLTDHWYNDWSPSFSPDGALLAFESDTHGQDAVVFVMDLATGTLQTIGGEAMTLARGPAWSPDGRSLAFFGGGGDYAAIGVYDVEREIIAWAWDGHGNAHDPSWSPDGRSLAFVVDDGPENSLWHLDLTTDVAACIERRRRQPLPPRLHPRRRRRRLCAERSRMPRRPVLGRARVGHRGGASPTRCLPTWTDHEFGSGVPVIWESRDLLADVPGLFCEPQRFNGAGVVIIHGGPTWHHSDEWDPVRQALLDAGCMVIHPNYRGSDGYTRRWQLANRYLLGQGEAQDCASAVDFLIEQGCDPRRIAVTGRSHGGYLTMQMLTQFPELWACGVAGVPFFDHIDAQVDPAVRSDLVWWDLENCGDMVKDRARLEYYRRSTTSTG